MESPVRIAVVGTVDDRVVGDLTALPLRPEVRRWQTVCGDTDALVRFQPAVLVVALGPDAAEEIGALRLLRRLWPDVGMLLLGTSAREVADGPLAQRLGARLVVDPSAPGRLAEAIEQAFHGSGRPRNDVFVDLARGVADEVNNPLMAVAGQLQLLRGGLDPATESTRRDQVTAALAAVQRIQAAVDRLRLVAQAAGGPRRPKDIDLAGPLGAALAARGTAPAAMALAIDDGRHVVRGDKEQVEAALTAVANFAVDLTTAGASCALRLDTLPGGERLRLTATGPGLLTWALPTTFEPYYPNRALKNPGFGMGLFLAQTVVLGHRGQATARRLPDGSLQIDLVWPT